jgi:DNA-binding transcriptional MocR family regulator
VFLPEGNNMETLLPEADQAGLKLTDGRGFFINPQDGDRFLRIPFCTLNPQDIDDAIERLSHLLK